MGKIDELKDKPFSQWTKEELNEFVYSQLYRLVDVHEGFSLMKVYNVLLQAEDIPKDQILDAFDKEDLETLGKFVVFSLHAMSDRAQMQDSIPETQRLIKEFREHPYHALLEEIIEKLKERC